MIQSPAIRAAKALIRDARRTENAERKAARPKRDRRVDHERVIPDPAASCGGMRQRDPRLEEPVYLAAIRLCPCILCMIEGATQKSRTEACHPKFGLDGHWREFGGGEKSHDRMAVPLCGGRHHRESNRAEHQIGQRKFWTESGVILPDLIADLNAAYDARRDLCVTIQQHCIRAMSAQLRERA